MKYSLRITGGALSGQSIATPGGGTHPMGERERLAIFNSLGDSVAGARVLDMFAGSGALGIEALSRNAQEVVFVDNSATARSIIVQNLNKLGLDQALVYPKLLADSGPFDLIFADPSYDADLRKLRIGELYGLLAPAGTLILSTDKHINLPEDLFDRQLVLISDKTYARARITMWQRSERQHG